MIAVISTALVATAFTILVVIPDAPLARRLHAGLIVPVAARLDRVRRGHLLLILAVSVVLWFAGMEVAKVAAMALPEVAAWASLIDLGILPDVGAALVVTAAVTPLRSLARAARSRRLGSRPRRRKTRAQRTKPANDDNDEDRSRRAA